MRKNMARLVSLMLAVIMTFALTVTAFADDTKTYTLTLENTGKTTHSFEVYQIFKGDLSEKDNKTTLSNIAWGDNINPSTEGKTPLGDAAEYAKTITDSNVAAVAETLSGYLTAPIKTVEVEAGKKGTVTGLAAGYYFVKDKAESQTGDNSAYTSYILEVVKDTEAKTKLDAPTVEKKVKDVNESTGDKTDWQDSADYKVGQEIPYQITGTLPSNYDKYETYYYQFSDTMSKGLTYITAEGENINATIMAGSMAGSEDITSHFAEKVKKNEDGTTTVTWTCDNLKAITSLTKDSKIVVTYSAKLNDQAVMGSEGNPNTVDLTYSNNPNKGGDGDHGKTPEDKNIVFTYNVTVNKYSESVADENKLTGAGFTLYKKIKTIDADGNAIDDWVQVGDEQKGEALTTFTWNRVDDGDYKLVETTVPEGYNKMKDVEFTITAEHKNDKDEDQALKLTDLSGNTTTGEASFTAEKTNGTLTSDIINHKGSTLPSTGGMGTTLIYALGIILMLGAGIVLVTRAKVNRQ